VTDSTLRRFDAPALFAALDSRPAELSLSWKQVADQIWSLSSELNARRHEHSITPSMLKNVGAKSQLVLLLECSPSQLTGLRTARYAAGMDVAMRIVQWLDRPAADFIYSARW